MELTQEKINTYIKRGEEAEKIAIELSDMLKGILDKQDKIKYKNSEDKEIEVLDRVALDEVKYLGADCNAGKALKEKYPELFELDEKAKKNQQELLNLQRETFGFTHREMTLANIIKLIQGIKCL